MRQMNLEPIIQSEVSQKEKDKYHVLIHLYGIQKDGTDEIVCSNGETDIENRLMDLGEGGQEGEGEMYGESNMETYIAIYKVESQCEFAE